MKNKGFAQIINALSGIEAVKIKKHDEFNVLKESMIEYLQDIIGFEFPKPVKEFYSACNGFYFKWQMGKMSGNILIPSMLGMFSNFLDVSDHENAFEGILWTKTDYDKKEIKERKKHKVFEFFEGDSPCTTITFKIDQTYQLYHVDSEIYPIPLTINGYVKMVADLYGFGNFRYYLHEPDFYSNPLKYCPELERLRHVIPSFNLNSLDFKQYLTIV